MKTEGVLSVDDDGGDDDNAQSRSPGSGFNDVLGHSRRIPPPRFAPSCRCRMQTSYIPLPRRDLANPLVLVDPSRSFRSRAHPKRSEREKTASLRRYYYTKFSLHPATRALNARSGNETNPSPGE